MEENLKILMLEDSPEDAELVEYELRKAGISFVSKHVETRDGFIDGIDHFRPDLILADYKLPGFDGASAFEISRNICPEVPFIFVSGAIGEETAVDMIKKGATDYVIKEHISKIGHSVKRALNEVKERILFKEAEEEIKSLARFVSENPAPVFRISSSGILLFSNKSSEILLNGWNCKLNCPVPLRIHKLVLDTLSSGEKRIISEEISGYIFSFLVVPLSEEHYVNFYGTDITELKKLEEQLNQAQKMEAVGLLAGGIAHDFNNILTFIQGYSELAMMKTTPGEDSIFSYLEEINQGAIRAANLTRQLLLFSRKQPMKITQVNINDVIENLAKMLIRLIGENYTIHIETQPDIWEIQGDIGHLEQVITNLVVNARDAMPEKGDITIKTENITLTPENTKKMHGTYLGKFVCFSVKDTGSGMKDEIIQKIFDPFFTTKESGKGTGLGLSVIYGIVKQHNGFINVESEYKRGSVFKICIPAYFSENKENKTDESSEKYHKGNRERILIIEDEEKVLNIAVSVLEENNYIVFKASDANEAINIFEKESGNFDLIFSDTVLPDKNGLEVVDYMLSIKPELLVLMTTGYTDETLLMKITNDRKFNLLNKPFSIYALLKAVKEVLGN